MENNEIIKSNKLIAEFIGFPTPKVGDVWYYNRSLCNSTNTILKIFEIKDNLVYFYEKMAFRSYGLDYFDGYVFYPRGKHDHKPCNNYHESWNWLMPVVEKIETLGYFCMINNWTSVYTGSDGERISVTTVEGKSKIENTYKAITIFIKWYNENKK